MVFLFFWSRGCGAAGPGACRRQQRFGKSRAHLAWGIQELKVCMVLTEQGTSLRKLKELAKENGVN